MDLITQTVLGAAVGEATLGKKAGNKAILWGAIGGLIPDLDVLVTPFYNVVDGLFVHRGFSHSLIFAFILAPPMGFLLSKLYKKNSQITSFEWTKLIFLAAFTHPFLDYLTTYGTGAFEPFFDYRVEFSTIGIVDLFYTLPLLLVLLIILFMKRSSVVRRKLIVYTLILTTTYLGATVLNKIYINSVFEKSYANHDIRFESLKTTPLPLTNFLWMGLAEVDNGYYLGLYSVFDDSKPNEFIFLPRNEDLITKYRGQESLEKLIKFTKGYYIAGKDDNGIYVADLRFGKAGIGETSDYVFKFYIKENATGIEIVESKESRKVESGMLSDYINRILGNS